MNEKKRKKYSCQDDLQDYPLFSYSLQEINKINSKEELRMSEFKSSYPKAKYITSTVKLIDNLLSLDLHYDILSSSLLDVKIEEIVLNSLT